MLTRLTRGGATVLLCLLLAAGCTGRDAAGRIAPPPEAPTVNHHTSGPTVMRTAVLGVKPDWYHIGAAQGYAQRLGSPASWVPVVWCDVEKAPGQWDWTTTDQLMAAARSLGFQMHLRIRVGACWLTRHGPRYSTAKNIESEMPTDLGAYAAFVKAVVERYSRFGVREYAVENEPNTRYQWGGTLVQLLRLTQLATTTIRRVDRRAVLVDWGLSTGVYGEAVAQQLLNAGHDRRAMRAYNRYYRTAIRSTHVSSPGQLRTALYTGQGRRDLVYLAADARLLSKHVFDVRQIHFYESAAILPSVLAYLRSTTPAGRPIEAWEVGRHAATAAPVARFEIVKTVCLMLAAGVREVDWLPLMAPRGGDERNLALLNENGTMRAAGRDYLQLATLVRKGSFIRAISMPDLGGIAIGDGRRTTLVVWSDTPGGGEINLGVPLQVQNMDGSASQTRAVLRTGSHPVLATINEPPRTVLAAIR